MISINNYVLATSLEEAYENLIKNRNNNILGGTSFLRMSNKKIHTAIDLSNLDLNYITETDTSIEIGAMTNLRTLETSSIINNHFNGILAKCVSHIVGVQLRNNVTIGASIFSKFGFSDLISALLVLDVDIHLFNKGVIKLKDFLEEKPERDILVKIVIHKKDIKCTYLCLRNAHSDFPILNVALSVENNNWLISVGARPQCGSIATKASNYLSTHEINDDTIDKTSIIASDELIFGTNTRASKEYRQHICKILIQRGIKEVLSWK